MDSFPKYEPQPVMNVAPVTKHTKYHGIDIEIKGNHPLADSYNYALKIEKPDGFRDESGSSEIAQLSQVPNPSPLAKGSEKKSY